MISGFIVQKMGMSGFFTEDGKRIAVTQLKASPVVVTQLKTPEKDKYTSVQVAYGTREKVQPNIVKKLDKLKLKLSPKGFAEFQLQPEAKLEVGSQVTIDQVFQVGDSLKATGTSKGRGFAGVIKRHGFHRQPVTGGQSDRTRAPGAIGAQTPGKVLKGKKMPGHMGNKTFTVLNLPVIKIDPENQTLHVRGSVPGHSRSWLLIYKS